MRKLRFGRLLPAVLLAVLGTLAYTASNEECTTAVISGAATADGKPILWKNRDTNSLSNKVVFVNEKPFSYLAVVNAKDTSGRTVWSGLNAAGFAIENSASYNLPEKADETKGHEGIIMADALRTCETVDDFEAFIQKNLSPSLGSHANYGVIDAHGGAASFEVSNEGYKRYNAGDAAEPFILKTNFSVSGTADKGAGYIRFDRETALFKTVPPGKLAFDFILRAARDLRNPYEHAPAPEEWKNLPADTPYWVHSNYTINRVLTASVMIVHGAGKGENPQRATMWVILGEPVTSIAVPLWVAAGETPAEVREGKDAPITREADRLKAILRPLKGSDRHEYLDLTKLDNRAGTGWLPGNLKVENEILDATKKFLEGTPSPAELAAFEREMAAKALARLQAIK
jgi:hypothetical protein